MCKGGDPEDGVMCYDKAMDQFFTSTGHERFVDCRKLNQTKGKAEAIEELLREIEAEKVERAACEASVRECIESVETSCMKVSPCAGCGCMATGLVVSDLSRGGFECLRVNPENEQSMQQELAMLAACQWPSGEAMFPNVETARTVHEHNGRLYHLDRAGCSGGKVQMCVKCTKACKDYGTMSDVWPPNMVVGGSDFGSPSVLGLEPLGLAERVVVSKVRVFDSIIKLSPHNDGSQDALKGQVVSFKHDAADQVADAGCTLDGFLDCDVSKHLHVMFVGAEAIWGRLKTSQLVLREIEVDAKKIIMWLVALSVFNNEYKGLRQTFFPDPKSPTAFHNGTFDVALTQAHFDDRLDSIVHGATIADSGVAQELNQAGGAPLHTEQASTRPTSDEQLALPHVFLDAPIGHRCDQSPEEQTLRGAISARVGVSATGGSEPLSEFSENDTLILGAFPDLFFLGTGVAKCGSVPNPVVKAWLHHHSMRFERNAQLLFLLFNQKQRHKVCQDVVATVNSQNMQEFCDLINHDDFLERANSALLDLESDSSKALISQITRLSMMAGKEVPFSSAERQAAVGKLYSMVQFYGLPSWFVTVSPGETNNKLVMTISSQPDPGWSEQGIVGDNVKSRAPFKWSTEFDYSKRARRVAENPVAAAKHFAALAHAMMEHLCKLPCHNKRKKTCLGGRGALGQMIAHFAALECQGRGSLHFHAVMWSGLTPELLQALATKDPDLSGLKAKAAEVLDSMATAKLDAERHERRDADLKERLDGLNGNEGPATFVLEGDGVEKFVQKHVANVTNFHTHSATCRKGKYGHKHCRLAKPSPICQGLKGKTGPIELTANPNESIAASKGSNMVAAPVDSLSPVAYPETRAEFLDSPFKNVDHRLVQWELGREGMNGDGRDELVVPYSLSFSASGGCNTAVVPLGSSEQAKAVCFYLLKYITKDPTALEVSRVVIHQAILHMAKHPSRAEDVGQDTRNAKHLLQRMLNSVQGAQEISAQMAATALLGEPACFSSDSFWYAFIWPAINAIKNNMASTCVGGPGGEGDCIDADEVGDECVGEEVGVLAPEFDEDINLQPVMGGSNGTNGGAALHPVKGADGETKTVAIPQHEHYIYRSSELQKLNFQEFVSTVELVKQKEPKEKGRKSNKKYDFRAYGEHQHPLHGSHCLRFRCKRKVPVLAGAPPPLLPSNPQSGGAQRASANRFAEYLLILLVPWETTQHADGSLQIQCNQGKLTYNDFCMKMKEWHDMSKPMNGPGRTRQELTGLSRATFAENIARGLRVNTKRKQQLTSYRYSTAQIWPGTEGTWQGDSGGDASFDCNGAPDDEEELSAMAALALRAVQRKVQPASDDEKRLQAHEDAVMDHLCSIGAQQPDCGVANPHSPPSAPDVHSMLQQLSPDHIAEVIARLAEAAPTKAACTAPTSQPAVAHKGANGSAQTVLNGGQAEVFKRVVGWHEDLVRSRSKGGTTEPLVLLVHGPPGTGKTRLADAIARQLPCAAAAPTGVAATLFLDAVTIHGLLGLPTDSKNKMAPLGVGRATALRTKLDDADVLLFDEVSFVDPLMVNRIDQRLRQLKQNPSTPFGGMSVVFFGDFFQLDPCFYGSLTSAVVNYYEGKPVNNKHETEIKHAAKLFATIEKHELTEQMRSQDVLHNKHLDELRSMSPGCRPISSSLLKDQTQLTSCDLAADGVRLLALAKQKEKISCMRPGAPKTKAEAALKLSTIETTKSLWCMAPIAVTNNRLRHKINRHKAKVHASNTGQLVFEWGHKPVGRLGDALSSPDFVAELEQVRTDHAALTGRFVAGAPGHLLINLNPTKRLANGTPVIYHSLTFKPEDQAKVDNLIADQRKSGIVSGATIKVPVPESINVAVPSVLATDDNIGERVAVTDCTHVSPSGALVLAQCIVIPIPLLHKCPNAGPRKHFEAKLPRAATAGFLSGTKFDMLKYEAHPVTISFALTYHKLQGQTLSKLILDLNKAPKGAGALSLRHVYVGMSRVKTANGLRILPFVSGGNQHGHLLSKKHCPNLITYLSGFAENGSRYQHAQEPHTPARKKRTLTATNCIATHHKKQKTKRLG